jgi:hypothetical protein
MENLKYRLGIGVTVFIFIYLLGSFVEASFNIALWNKPTRGMVALLGGLLSVVFATYPFYKFKK